ncbi:MAG: hypothetical protein RIQ89_1943 [Bacteroidota bacterium]|jgi:hypothetical protein
MASNIEIEIIHNPVKDIELMLQYSGGDVLVEFEDGLIDGIEVEFGNIGAQGPAGQSGTLYTMTLVVISNGQTSFNIISTPAGYNELEVNGVNYYEGEDYMIGLSGLNVHLTWLNSFELNTADKLLFKKY